MVSSLNSSLSPAFFLSAFWIVFLSSSLLFCWWYPGINCFWILHFVDKISSNKDCGRYFVLIPRVVGGFTRYFSIIKSVFVELPYVLDKHGFWCSLINVISQVAEVLVCAMPCFLEVIIELSVSGLPDYKAFFCLLNCMVVSWRE